MSLSEYSGVSRFLDLQYASSPRFIVNAGWTVGLGFSELAGFNSTVDHQEYAYNDLLGNVHTKQFGRSKPPSITLKRALDAPGFAQIFAWHAMARMNNPLCKVSAMFVILDAGGMPVASCVLENAWCARLEMDAAQAGSSTIVMMKTTIECDSILMI